MRTSLAIGFTLLISHAFASDVASEIRDNTQHKMLSSLKSVDSQNKVQDIINYQGVNVPEVALKNGDMLATAQEKVASEDSEAKVVHNAFVKAREANVTRSSKWFDKGRKVEKHPEQYVDWLVGKYEDCEGQDLTSIFSKQEQVCDELNEMTEEEEVLTWQTEIERRHNYECTRKLNSLFKKCSRHLIVSIESQEDCDSANITWKSGGKFNYSYPNLNISASYGNFNIQDIENIDVKPAQAFSLPKAPAGYNSIVEFTVLDPALLEEVIIENAIRFQYTTVYVNEKIVLGAVLPPLGRKCVGIGHGEKKCYLAFDQMKQVEAQVRAKPEKFASFLNITKYLKAGVNSMRFQSYVNQEGSLTLRIKQRCLVERDTWVEKCEHIKEAS